MRQDWRVHLKERGVSVYFLLSLYPTASLLVSLNNQGQTAGCRMDVELLVFHAHPSLLSVSEEDKKRRPRQWQIYVIVFQGTGDRNYSFSFYICSLLVID